MSAKLSAKAEYSQNPRVRTYSSATTALGLRISALMTVAEHPWTNGMHQKADLLIWASTFPSPASLANPPIPCLCKLFVGCQGCKVVFVRPCSNPSSPAGFSSSMLARTVVHPGKTRMYHEATDLEGWCLECFCRRGSDSEGGLFYLCR